VEKYLRGTSRWCILYVHQLKVGSYDALFGMSAIIRVNPNLSTVFGDDFAPHIVLEPEVKSRRSLAVGSLRFSMVRGICQGCVTE